MKKIDFHIHTVPSISDSFFNFNLDKLEEYVKKMEIDCIAITNHNLFDKSQFLEISNKLDIKVFPGIEINLEGGHLLLISENENLVDFDSKCHQISKLINSVNESITYEQLINIFPLLNKYLLIPHYDKNPNIKTDTLQKLGDNIFVGEVTSIRKFRACIKDSNKLVPVIFSDCRLTDNIDSFSPRQTFVKAGDDTLFSIKGSLSDKLKVSLSKNEGNDYFQATDDGLILSTGLNVIIGERSTGKTFTLNKICKNFENVKYIKQFSLLQNDEESFNNVVTKRHSLVTESYLKEFKDVVQDVNQVDLKDNELKLGNYIDSLKKFASESDKLDTFSKCKLFNETKFEINELNNLNTLIKATETLIENVEYNSIVNRYISEESLRALLIELIKKHNELYKLNLQRYWLNDLIDNIKDSLRFRSTTTAIEDIDFYDFQIDKIKVKKFTHLVQLLQYEKEIDSKDIRGFKVVASTKKYTGASHLKSKSRSKLSFSKAYENYDNPYRYLIELQNIGIEETEFYKYFVDIEYKTLNKHGFPISGGERSEFNLLHEINDALKHDVLLIDEPESSFDNLFLKSDVNSLIKDISKEIPVVVVTHNNTIGASIKPDHVVYTQKKVHNGKVEYSIFFGHPTSKQLKSAKGETIDNLDIMLNCLEAGERAYNERKTQVYEILKN